MNKLPDYDPFFRQRSDCTGLIGLSSIQKVTAALRQLAYGSSANSIDECLGIGDSTALLFLKRFRTSVISLLHSEYMRKPTQTDLEKILVQNAARGFPGMLAGIDCCKWVWKSCPVGHH